MNKRAVLWVLLMAWVFPLPSWAQWQVHESVLSHNTWYKVGVTENGVYGIDCATLQSLGVDVQNLNPSHIRLFGNTPGVLPEHNAKERYDDLTEIAIQVTGSEDGSFDGNDKILFYANGPVNMKLTVFNMFGYERNPYTDTLYYFLCVDSDVPGLRMQEKPSAPVEGGGEVTSYVDCVYRDNDELSPYASGRTWYGDLFTAQEGYEEFVFDIPGLDVTKPVWTASKVLGRGRSSFTYSLKVNDNAIIHNYSFAPYQQQHREFGKEHETMKSCSIQSGPIRLRYEINPNETNPMLYIDYFTIAFWRALRFRGHETPFVVVSSQIDESQGTLVRVEGVNADVRCWEVTDPMCPVTQQTDLSGAELSFGVDEPSEHRYHLFDAEGVKEVASCYPIRNQNLHGITDAELLIITPREFWNPSEALAVFHRERDAMDCVLVDVKEIFNEFGTGIPDPTAIRDFIRMVYLRSNGNLKYVLLMGKGTHDFRRLKGVDNNFVPTYQMASNAFLEVESKCSDDYYALMDANEGIDCEGLVDLGVGRIPITTAEQGDGVVAKIMHYADLAQCYGPWKNNHLMMADNDARTYMNYAEDLERVLDTAWHNATVKKLYLDSYPLVNTPSGIRIPQANKVLMDYLEKGVGVMSYTGHGGVTGLPAEQVLTISDILSMTNYDNLPFVHTATCEFSKFDNPNVVSAGEHMMLNPQGGAIAMLTTTRPTYAPNNHNMSKSFHEHVYDRDGENTLRFGDIFRIVKADHYSKANLVYVLFGDPALRFYYPTHDIRTERLGGEDICTVEGYIKSPNAHIDTEFNGVLYYRVYDQKSVCTTLGNYSDPMDYSFFNDVLFEGKASVTDGRFSFQFPVPANVNPNSGNGRLSYYAFDSIRNVEANGVFDALHMESPDVTDDQGPDIHLYWNTPDFADGSIVSRNGVLYADLYDEHGIYHYNVSIGRDMVLKSNVPTYDNLILNEQYESVVDDYQRGRVVLPINDLQDGIYEFSLKAWDTQNNASEADIMFVVQQGNFLAQVHNTPNPFTDETWFSFTHGDMTDHLSVVIEVFDMMGRRLTELHEETDAVCGVVNPIHWDGSVFKAGLYLYKITITNSEGKTKTLSQRMIKK